MILISFLLVAACCGEIFCQLNFTIQLTKPAPVRPLGLPPTQERIVLLVQPAPLTTTTPPQIVALIATVAPTANVLKVRPPLKSNANATKSQAARAPLTLTINLREPATLLPLGLPPTQERLVIQLKPLPPTPPQIIPIVASISPTTAAMLKKCPPSESSADVTRVQTQPSNKSKSLQSFKGNSTANKNSTLSSAPELCAVFKAVIPATGASALELNVETLNIGTLVNKTQVDRNASGRVLVQKVIGLCGFPPYNDRIACLQQNFFIDPLSGCEKTWGRILFGVLVGLMAIGIIFINCLIVYVFVRNSDARSQYEYIKVSLAFADMIIGFLLFATVIPNMIWIRNITEQQAAKFTVESTNSARAIIVGSLLTITMQASLLHLAVLSIERFMAIKWSFWHMKRKTSSIMYTLVAIWIASIISAFSPAAFPHHFEYKFQPTLLIHMLTLKLHAGSGSVLGYHGPLYAAFTIILPYVVTACFCVATGVASYQMIRAASRKFGKERQSLNRSTKSEQSSLAGNETGASTRSVTRKRLQPEISVFITILIMIGIFTITLLPFTIVMILFVGGLLNCVNYQIPYVVSFYFSLLNSLANGIIYSARDAKFRSAVQKHLCCRAEKKSNNSTRTVTSSYRSSTIR